jgi:ribonuclease BN (tRNA processing enzyme)
MEIKFIGFGGAFDYQYGNSAALININNKTILLDCGHSVYPALRAKNKIDAFEYVLITHLHDDHAGSLSTLIFHRHFSYSSQRIKIIYPEEKFKKEIYNYLVFSMQKPEKYFDFISIEAFAELDFIDTYGKHSEGMQTYSYIFNEDNEKTVYSGDLGDPDFLFAKLKEKRIENASVFHDTYFSGKINAHAYYKELQKHADKYNIIGYHHDPAQKPLDCTIEIVGERKDLQL